MNIHAARSKQGIIKETFLNTKLEFAEKEHRSQFYNLVNKFELNEMKKKITMLLY